MDERSKDNVVGLDATQLRLRTDFLKWQCRLRLLAMVHADGRPQSGMRPFVRLPEDQEARARITVLLLKEHPETSAAELRHIFRRSLDPLERHNGALDKLSGSYYENPEEFSDRLTALFGYDVPLAEELLQAGRCILDFEQGGQSYTVPCSLEQVPDTHPAFQATYWHNSLFNPELPPDVLVLRFTPSWSRAVADPVPA